MTKCSIKTLSELLYISQPRIRQLTQLGIIPKAGRGRYELEKAVQGYILYLRGCLARHPHPTTPQYRKRRMKLQGVETLPSIEPREKTTWIPLTLAQRVIKEQMSLLVEELAALPRHKSKALEALKARHYLTIEPTKARSTKREEKASSPDELAANLLLQAGSGEEE